MPILFPVKIRILSGKLHIMNSKGSNSIYKWERCKLDALWFIHQSKVLPTYVFLKMEIGL